LNEFWDAGGGGLELTIDISSQTLHALCHFIQTCQLLHLQHQHQLELAKISIELNMPSLRAAVITAIIRDINFDNIESILDFSLSFEMLELQKACEEYLNINDNAIGNTNSDALASNSNASAKSQNRDEYIWSSETNSNANLKEAIAASLKDVSAVLGSSTSAFTGMILIYNIIFFYDNIRRTKAAA